jgi:predicted negative regulator of RcsB-dependent stress response
MATARKRITRKQLRQPDWFHIATEKALAFYGENRIQALLGITAVIVLLLAILAWQFFKERQDTQAAVEFSQAMTLYQAEKYRAAVPAFQKVEAYRWSHYSILAHLYEANSYLAIHDLDKAITATERFIAGTSSHSLLRQIGLLTLATAEEQKNQCKQAIGHYAEAAAIKEAFQDRGVLGKARCAEQLGDTKGALGAYKEYLKDNPDSPLTVHIAELEAKAGGQPIGGNPP